MNILFKINQPILIAILIIISAILTIFLYFQYNQKENINNLDYEIGADLINPKFLKEKKDNNYLKVVAKKASFISDNKIFLEGNVKYSSNNFILESNKVNFDQDNFEAYSNEKTVFKSDKIFVTSQGFKIKDRGNIISFIGKCQLTIQ